MDNIKEILQKAKDENKIFEESYENILLWLNDKEYENQIIEMILNNQFRELNDSFFTRIKFGTGGIRGVRGIGPNRVNKRTIGESAQGLASYILKKGDKNKGVVIAYDTRIMSKEFAEETAKVLVGNNIKTYLFDGFRATPELSFAVRFLKAQSGIVISASHNPPEDNGFKVYWQDGGQIVPPIDKEIIEEVYKVKERKIKDLTQAIDEKLLMIIGKEIDEEYLKALEHISLTHERNAKIVYSSLHGVGSTSIVPILKKLGFKNLYFVDHEMVPDGNFSTIKNRTPNPEEDNALLGILQKATEIDADVGMASDPDADRLRIIIKENNIWKPLNGNQLAAILTYYILNQNRTHLPKNGVIAKTIVTTDLINKIAKDFGIKVIDDLLIGFKYIGEVINNLDCKDNFIFGVEESLGYIRETFVRDKDAAIAAILVAELVSKLKKEKKSISEYLNEIYKKYGYYKELTFSLPFGGAEGMFLMKKLMENLRNSPFESIGNYKVIKIIDRKKGKEFRIDKKKTTKITGTKGDVLIFYLDKGKKITIRPSGTEPKIKIYLANHQDIKNNEELVKINVDNEIEEIKKDIISKLQAI